MTRLRLVTLAILAFSTGSCGFSGVACPAIACVNGLYVKLAATPSGPYRIEVTSPGDPTPRVHDCASATACGTVLLFQEYKPVTAVITVSYAGRTDSTNVVPNYATQSLNDGPCRSLCTSATVTVDLP